MLKKAGPEDLTKLAALALKLWPDSDLTTLEDEFKALLTDSGALLVLYEQEGQARGFAHCQIRRDYVEGCEPGPVGYLEGLYVDAPCRGQGIGAQLVQACEAWAQRLGCRSFASDCELDNAQSLRFHLRQGFREANRIICFVKELPEPEPKNGIIL